MNTPVEAHTIAGVPVLVKRDDLFRHPSGVVGGKGRLAAKMVATAVWNGFDTVVTATARHSLQMKIVARLANHYDIRCRCHCSNGEETPEMKDARLHGASIVQHKAGYQNVLNARQRADVEESLSRCLIPFGLASPDALVSIVEQVKLLPWGQFRRVVVPIGSGTHFAGVCAGVLAVGAGTVPGAVVGIRVGADPRKSLNTLLPEWGKVGVIVDHNEQEKYEVQCAGRLDKLPLDPYYEAKCAAYLKEGDLLWIVGHRDDMV